MKDEKIRQNELYPLHDLILSMDTGVVDYRPAGHALTRCNSVAKVGTKASMLKALRTAYC